MKEGVFIPIPPLWTSCALIAQSLALPDLELEAEGLIYYRWPYYFVRNIEAGKEHAGGCKRKDIPEVIRDLAKESLKDISRKPR